MSFFYHISATDFNAPTLTDRLTDRFLLQLNTDNTLSLACALSLPFKAATSFSCTERPVVSRLRVFGMGFNLHLPALLKLVTPDTAVAGRYWQPHPQLHKALELELTVTPDAATMAALNSLALQHQFELVCLNAYPKLHAPGVLVMDMDSTAIQIECIDEIAKLAGTGEQVAAVTARAMNGELDFAQSLVARVATLEGAPESILQQVLQRVPLMPGLTELVEYLQQHQWQVAIASGGFTYFTDALKQQLGLTATFANVLEIIDGKLSGKVLGEIVDANTKAWVVGELAKVYAIAPQQTVAIGDGANDIPMLNAAGMGVAFHAKPKVQAQAKAAIRQGSLLQLLYLLD